MEEKEVSKETPAGNPYLKIIIIDDESTNIAGTLGITDERYNELCDIAKDAWNSNKTITDGLSKASVYAKHANELAVICFMFGAICQSQKASESIQELQKLTELLQRLKDGGSDKED
jgi:hypothetical protein